MAKLKTQGTQFQRLDTTASPNAYADVGQIVNISGPGGSTPEINVTALDSSAQEYLLGLQDEGTITLDLIYDYATTSTLHQQLETDRANQSEQTWRIRLTDSPQTTITFNGRVAGRTFDISTDDAIRASVDIRVTGAATFA